MTSNQSSPNLKVNNTANEQSVVIEDTWSVENIVNTFPADEFSEIEKLTPWNFIESLTFRTEAPVGWVLLQMPSNCISIDTEFHVDFIGKQAKISKVMACLSYQYINGEYF